MTKEERKGRASREARKNVKMISDAIEALGIDTPVQKVRVVGNRVELWPYGGSGEAMVWTAPGATAEDLANLTVKELRLLAEEHDIEIPSKIRKAELVDLILGAIG